MRPHHLRPFATVLPGLVLLIGALGLTGCISSQAGAPGTGSSSTTSTTTTTSTPTTPATTILSGNVHGGQSPVAGAHVYLLAVGTSGYGGPSVSVLSSSVTGLADSTGAYVLTDNVGGFSIPSNAVNCSSDQMTYLLVTGGNAGFGVNTSSSLIAAYGPCPSGSVNESVWVDEVTTIGTSYALAAFATDAVHISSSGTSAAKQGVKNAFSVVPNLYSPALGHALAITPAGNGSVPQQTINTLANLLAACVNSAGIVAPACQSLFGASSPNQTVSDTASAAIGIAHRPAANVATLFALQAIGGAAFQPALSVAPTSYILPIVYTGGGLNDPLSVAVDASGDVWVGNGGSGRRNAFNTAGAPLSPNGFSDGLTGNELSLAIDTSGNIWALDASINGISEISPSGSILAPASQFASGNLQFPLGLSFDKAGLFWVGDDNGVTQFRPNGQVAMKVAIPSSQGDGVGDVEVDGLGNVWTTNFDDNEIVKLSSSGVPAFGVTGVGGGGLKSPEGIAFDSQNNVWVANANGSSLSKFGNNGYPFTSTGFTGGGLWGNRFLAVDGAGNVWTPSSHAGIISEFDTSGNPALSTGFNAKPGGTGFWGLAIDGSGNVWATSVDGALVQLVGAAAPVITPIATAATNNMLGTRP